LSEPKQSSSPKSAKVERTEQPSIHRSTGPRTRPGKEKSKLNARKHDLYSKAVLLEDESRAEYNALLNGLMENFQAQGRYKTLLVDYLATLFWRRRRCLQVESAEISKTVDFLSFDSKMTQLTQGLDYARPRGASGEILDDGNNLTVVRAAIDILYTERLALTSLLRDKAKHPEFARILYGENRDGDRAARIAKEVARLTAKFLAGKESVEGDDQFKERMGAALDEEIKRLKDLEDLIVIAESERIKYNLAAARTPSQEASTHLIQREAHFSREIERTVNQLRRE
jgi:hypothetical protein